MQANYAASAYISLWVLFLIRSTNQASLSPFPRPLPLSLYSWGGVGVRGHGGACVMLGQSWPTRLGLWRKAWVDLQQQPGRRADPARPTGGLNEAHRQTVLQRVEFRESRQKDWTRDSGGNITEEGRKRTSDNQRHCMLRWLSMDRAEMSDVGKESNKRLRAKSDGEKSNEQRKRFSNTETVSHWREDSF